MDFVLKWPHFLTKYSDYRYFSRIRLSYITKWYQTKSINFLPTRCLNIHFCLFLLRKKKAFSSVLSYKNVTRVTFDNLASDVWMRNGSKGSISGLIRTLVHSGTISERTQDKLYIPGYFWISHVTVTIYWTLTRGGRPDLWPDKSYSGFVNSR